jgi:RNA polymerase sigma factor (sigma-70 family)
LNPVSVALRIGCGIDLQLGEKPVTSRDLAIDGMFTILGIGHSEKESCMPTPRSHTPSPRPRHIAGAHPANAIGKPAEAGNLPDESELDARYAGWIAAIAELDRQALAWLYDATVKRVYSLALRISGNRENAEEVVEDVYLQVWRDAAHYDAERGRPLTWLLTICRSRALDYLRRLDEADCHPDPDSLRENDTDGSNPQDLLIAVERHHILHNALQKLTPIQRQFLALAFFKGYSHHEIAEHMDMPLGTVKTGVRRALQTINKHIHQKT